MGALPSLKNVDIFPFARQTSQPELLPSGPDGGEHAVVMRNSHGHELMLPLLLQEFLPVRMLGFQGRGYLPSIANRLAWLLLARDTGGGEKRDSTVVIAIVISG